MDLKFQYKTLVESLKLLASSFENQETYLPDYVQIKDEVVAIFEDAFLLLPQLIENDFLNKEAVASIIRCFNLMGITTRNDEASDEESFKNSESWHKIRDLANKALDKMQEKIGKPDLSYIDWLN